MVKITGKEQVQLSVLGKRTHKNTHCRSWKHANNRIEYYPFINEAGEKLNPEHAGFQIAGPTDTIYFDPLRVKAGIVTCGGICPGLNNVIRSIVLCLWHNYGVKKIVGFKYGLQGFISKYGHELVELNPEIVGDIHGIGGTILGTSRGPQSPEEITDALEMLNINQMYFVGGNGTLKAAHAVYEEIERRKLNIAVISIPKTIDNDIMYVSRSFGFDTAVEIATAAIRSAHVEAIASPNGIGLVKLMGRDSGFIAATASIAQRDVNFVLIPEIPFELKGAKGFLQTLKERIRHKKHAVIVVAEGAGQHLFEQSKKETDPSGNPKMGDIGVYLKNQINEFFTSEGIEINLKYIDPSYLIRSVPPNTGDNLFSATLAQNAVHAAMSGYTDAVLSLWHGVYCIIPSHLTTSGINRVTPEGRLWLNVLESTGQPDFVG